jgi:peptide/nickel transport system ATP-binding protein
MTGGDPTENGIEADRPVLRLEDLHVTIDVRGGIDGVVRPVDGVSLHVARGEMLGIVGESGCGKTMTALSVPRLLPAGGRISAGRVLLGEDDLARMSERELRAVRGRRVGMVFQDPMTSLNPSIPIGRQVAEPLALHTRLSTAHRRERAKTVLDLVGIPHAAERLDDYPHQLSGGMRQRVMIARALVCEPELLIADEPTTALDVTIQHQILELIDDLRTRLGMAVILVTHDLGVVAGRADRVAVMYAGKVVELTDTRSLFENPRHPYTEALFAALPGKASQAGEKLYSIPGLPPDLREPPRGCRFAARCRYATETCRDDEPPLRSEVPGHAYACFHPVSAEKPKAATTRPRDRAPADRAGAGAPLLSVDHLVKDFPVARGVVRRRTGGTVSAVSDVSFSLGAGETFGLVGESGCGKTTVGRCIAGLEVPTEGSIRIGETGARPRGRAARRQDAHLVFQDPYSSLDPRMRVEAIIAEPLVIHGLDTRAGRRDRVRELLAEVGLPADAAQRYPHEFSGGQRQRIGLARALALTPKLIVADEPVSALDVSVQAQVLNLMNDLQRRHGLTYLLISHDLSVVRHLSHRIGVMYLGKLVETGPAEEVSLRPRHPYTRGLIDTVPVADPRAEHEKKSGRESGGVRGELPSARTPPSGCRFRTRCPRARDRCAVEEPRMRDFDANGHQAACHFPLEVPETAAEAGRDATSTTGRRG